MSIDRRDFLKASAAGTIGLMSHLGADGASAAQPGMVTLEVRIEGLGGLVLDGPGPDIPETVSGAQSVFINNAIGSLGDPRHNPEANIEVSDLAASTLDEVKKLQEAQKKNDVQLLRAFPRSRVWNKLALEPRLGRNYVSDYRMFSFDLRDFDVSFEGQTESQLKLSRNPLGPQDCPPPDTDAGWASLHHLASLVRICGQGTIGAACLESTPPRSVSARVSMKGGTLACAKPRNQSYLEKIWKFGDKEDAVIQRVADAVVYRVTAPPPKSPGNTVFTMVLTPFKGVPGAGAPIKLELTGSAGNTISVTLVNVPTEPVLETNRVHHFSVYYDLLPPGAYDRPIPHVHKDCAKKDEKKKPLPTDSEPNYCPSGLYFTGKAGSY